MPPHRSEPPPPALAHRTCGCGTHRSGARTGRCQVCKRLLADVRSAVAVEGCGVAGGTAGPSSHKQLVWWLTGREWIWHRRTWQQVSVPPVETVHCQEQERRGRGDGGGGGVQGVGRRGRKSGRCRYAPLGAGACRACSGRAGAERWSHKAVATMLNVAAAARHAAARAARAGASGWRAAEGRGSGGRQRVRGGGGACSALTKAKGQKQS